MNDQLVRGNYRRISRECGLSPGHIGRILRGIHGTTFDSACRIADAAGVGLDDLRRHIIAEKRAEARRRRLAKAAA